jgi:hypothetical protein
LVAGKIICQVGIVPDGERLLMALSDCTIKVTNPDGTTRDVMNKAGTAMAVPTTASHTAHNVGSTDCQAVFVERK